MKDQEAPGDSPGATAAQRLSTRETADRLGVKPETVYAYVSRGQLSSRRAPGGRGSTFDAAEVDALARRTGRRDPSPTADPVFRTGITLIESDRYYFRGVDATELARRYGYEEVAEWLWTGDLRPGIRFTAPDEALAAARRAVDALPAHSGSTDRLRVAVIAAATTDPLRFDLSREAVLASTRTLIPTLVEALPLAGGRSSTSDVATGNEAALARRLWPKLTARPADEPSIAALDTALVLLIDHDLAASTLAARVAASAHAHPYAVVSAGLGVLEGPLHGAASGLAHRMLTEVLERGSAVPVVADHLRTGRRVPGLGHRLYVAEDPRARTLFDLLADIPQAAGALAAARDVVTTTARHAPLHANVDLALAVLSVSSGMSAEAGETVFAVSRTAGWIAHALEEYGERPLRMRPTGHYGGPRPPQPLPTVRGEPLR
ncbi:MULTISPECIES: citrate synthase [unclassified Streptomyces]|uniref:citrate synthase n=1 Tax=unclassified Streptomyces TaxID=2593676 RepID=UPI0022551F9E|nr:MULTISPECIES: citrate synthase [unclassified Streptomyces]MCX4789891.1 citrate synthase [Streptomyces sp. NBC_01221]MCX4794403.1 citrate synthase [Streptomyces sp. NBC_01242]WSP57966.1 citrate synthase [Streptomyces sp. NBC_01241]WSP62209.1 citrate synthase [Streptomyces sp. NBC_01240]